MAPSWLKHQISVAHTCAMCGSTFFVPRGKDFKSTLSKHVKWCNSNRSLDDQDKPLLHSNRVLPGSCNLPSLQAERRAYQIALQQGSHPDPSHPNIMVTTFQQTSLNLSNEEVSEEAVTADTEQEFDQDPPLYHPDEHKLCEGRREFDNTKEPKLRATKRYLEDDYFSCEDYTYEDSSSDSDPSKESAQPVLVPKRRRTSQRADTESSAEVPPQVPDPHSSSTSQPMKRNDTNYPNL